MAEISVFTDVLYLAMVASAAFSSAVTMAGPGMTWALVISAQSAIRWCPEVYCFCTVSTGALGTIAR